VSDVTDGTSNTIALSERVAASFGAGGKPSPSIKEGTLRNIPAITSNPSACVAATATITAAGRYTTWTEVKGKFSSIWQDGQSENVGFASVLAPNSVSCTNDTNNNADSNSAVLTASSQHAGGVHCLMVDGAVKFISDSIDTGNIALAPTANGKSPYGIWGAMGTRAGGDQVTE
jgi:prepilin-type processing-associated H-X9-DG protein